MNERICVSILNHINLKSSDYGSDKKVKLPTTRLRHKAGLNKNMDFTIQLCLFFAVARIIHTVHESVSNFLHSNNVNDGKAKPNR